MEQVVQSSEHVLVGVGEVLDILSVDQRVEPRITRDLSLACFP